MGKATSAVTTSPFYRSRQPLACVHSDLLGPIEPVSRGGKKYIISFIDDFTRYNSLYLLRTKSESFNAFLHFQKWVESNTGFKILKLKSDRGGEYLSSKFLAHLHEKAVDVERGQANCPEANSVSERFNRTLLGRMRTQFEQSGLPLFLRGELVMYSSLQINLSPSAAIGMKSPYSLLVPHLKGHHHPLKPTRFRPFGCLAYVLDVNFSKLKPTARRMVFVCLEPGSNAYRFWDSVSSKIIISVDAKFDKSTFPAKNNHRSPSSNLLASTFDCKTLSITPENISPTQTPATPVELVVETTNTPHAVATAEPQLDDTDESTYLEQQPTVEEPSPVEAAIETAVEDQPRRSTRTIITPERYGS